MHYFIMEKIRQIIMYFIRQICDFTRKFYMNLEFTSRYYENKLQNSRNF